MIRTAELVVGLDASRAAAGAKDFSVGATQEEEDSDLYLLAKTYFDLGEYQRAAATLKDEPVQTSKTVFLRGYALYLAGEKRKEEEMLERTDPLERCQVINANLKQLHTELSVLHGQGKLDGFGLYLFGMVLKEMGSKQKDSAITAKSVLLESVNAYPWNWSAWLDLATFCSDKEYLQSLRISNQCPWMVNFFHAHVLLEMQQQYKVALHSYQELLDIFPQR
jgi:anaphase-promoting complex subunit 8